MLHVGQEKLNYLKLTPFLISGFKILILVNCSGKCCDGFKWDKMSNTCIGICAFTQAFANVLYILILVIPCSCFLMKKQKNRSQIIQLFSACLVGYIGK